MAKTPFFHLLRLIARPPGGQKNLWRVLNHWLHTPALGKSLWNEPICWSHTPAVGKSLRDAHKHWSHTPAVGKCLRHEARYSPWQDPWGPLPPIWAPYKLKIPRKWPKRPFLHWHLIAWPPGDQKSLQWAPNHWLNTPAVGKSLWNVLHADRILLRWANI